MKYKIRFQKNNKINSMILQADNQNELVTHENYPSNVISIKPLKTDFNIHFNLKDNKKNMFELFKQLSIMLNANITITEAIELLKKNEQNVKVKSFLDVLDNSIKTSENLSLILKQFEKEIGTTSIIFLHLGIQNANIKEALNSLVEIQSQDEKTVKKFKNVLKYPFILLLSLVISVLMIFVYVIPNFEYIFMLLGDNLPLSTKILLHIRDILIHHYYLIVIFILFNIFLILYLYSKYRFKFDKFLSLQIPIVSPLIRNYMFYRLFLSISIIVKSKYQFQLAIKHSKDIINNLFIKKTVDNILIKIKNGSSIAQAFEQSNLFDNLTVKLLYTAEYTNNYEEVLTYITNLHKQKFEDSMKNFSDLLEPSIILTISMVVLWLVLAIMVPIWDMGTVVS